MTIADCRSKCKTLRQSRRARVLLLIGILQSTLGILTAAAADGLLNPDDPAYIRRQYAWFQAQPPARQQQLRRLHADFQQLPADDQSRLTKIAQTYNAWLAKLPNEDRQRVLTARTATDRLEVVHQIREREWVESQPKPYRDEYSRLDAEARRQKVQEWRADEAERREEWALAQKHWADNLPGRVPPPFAAERPATEAFITHLRENLTEPELRGLGEARAMLDEHGLWLGYGLLVARLADQHPIFPWAKVGPKDLKDLPLEVRRLIPKAADLPREVRKAQGRWPDFAVELTAYARKANLRLPPLGDCKRDQMPQDVVQLIDKLEKDLKKTDAGRSDLKALEDAQGRWPDYPRQVVDLARKYKHSIPGWTLPTPPNQPQFWDRLRAGKKAR